MLEPAGKGTVPLVATWGRWCASTAGLAVALAVSVEAYLGFMHSQRGFSAFANFLGWASVLGAAVIFALLRAEESRLARELRTARAGTAVLRAMVIRRRAELPFFARPLSTRLGTVAVLLADGDRSGALDLLAKESRLMRGGRLEQLRDAVEADLERADGTPAGLEHCVQRLQAGGHSGNRECDLYRIHVLVKAVLELGDSETGLEIARAITERGGDEERVYATWLRVWFGLDDTEEWTALSEGEIRVAALAARSHGAIKLVEMLEERLGAIAHQEQQG